MEATAYSLQPTAYSLLLPLPSLSDVALTSTLETAMCAGCASTGFDIGFLVELPTAMPAKYRTPVVQRLYRRYLHDPAAAVFIRDVSQCYTIATLERLAEYGSRQTRRAATLALGLLADFRSNAVLGRRLRDADRGVRLLSETGLREVWDRDGSEYQQLWLRRIRRLNSSGEHARALAEANSLLDDAPWFAEVWNQRAVAHARLGAFRESISDGRKVLERNPFHFSAATEMGHSYLQIENASVALECFRLALNLHPGLERVRIQIARLNRKLKRKS